MLATQFLEVSAVKMLDCIGNQSSQPDSFLHGSLFINQKLVQLLLYGGERLSAGLSASLTAGHLPSQQQPQCQLHWLCKCHYINDCKPGYISIMTSGHLWQVLSLKLNPMINTVHKSFQIFQSRTLSNCPANSQKIFYIGRKEVNSKKKGRNY